MGRAALLDAHGRRRSVYLSTVGAIGGFVAYTYALRHLPVSLVSLYAYINPMIAVALGVAVLGEPFTRAWRLPPRWCSAAWPSCARPAAVAGAHARQASAFRPDAR